MSRKYEMIGELTRRAYRAAAILTMHGRRECAMRVLHRFSMWLARV